MFRAKNVLWKFVCMVLVIGFWFSILGCAGNNVGDCETEIGTFVHEKINYNFEYQFSHPKSSWEDLDLSKTTYKSKEEFEQTLLGYIDKIEEVTGITDWYKMYGDDINKVIFKIDLRDYIKDGSGAYMKYGVSDGTDKGVIASLSISYTQLESGTPFISHELCHFMFGDIFSQSIEEGLCGYMLRQIEGSQMAGVNVFDELIGLGEEGIYSTGSQAVIKEYEDFKQEAMPLIGCVGNTYPYGMSGNKAVYWYSYSEAFVTYLIDSYGMIKFMNFYQNAEDIDDYKIIADKSYEILVGEWSDYYNSYKPTVHYKVNE